jgi:hypothetical protein
MAQDFQPPNVRHWLSVAYATPTLVVLSYSWALELIQRKATQCWRAASCYLFILCRCREKEEMVGWWGRWGLDSSIELLLILLGSKMEANKLAFLGIMKLKVWLLEKKKTLWDAIWTILASHEK